MIIRCLNKDSLNRQCKQFRWEGKSQFCGAEKGELCAHLATDFVYEKEKSEETKLWLERHS